jgi:hypothetical protein
MNLKLNSENSNLGIQPKYKALTNAIAQQGREQPIIVKNTKNADIYIDPTSVIGVSAALATTLIKGLHNKPPAYTEKSTLSIGTLKMHYDKCADTLTNKADGRTFKKIDDVSIMELTKLDEEEGYKMTLVSNLKNKRGSEDCFIFSQHRGDDLASKFSIKDFKNHKANISELNLRKLGFDKLAENWFKANLEGTDVLVRLLPHSKFSLNGGALRQKAHVFIGKQDDFDFYNDTDREMSQVGSIDKNSDPDFLIYAEHFNDEGKNKLSLLKENKNFKVYFDVSGRNSYTVIKNKDAILVDKLAFKPFTSAGFNYYGKNSSAELRKLTSFEGRSIAKVETSARRKDDPNREYFLGKNESLIETLVADNDYVLSKNLTHQQLANPLINAYNAASKKIRTLTKFSFNGEDYIVQSNNNATPIEPFSGRLVKEHQGGKLGGNFRITRASDGAELCFSALHPHQINKYGFYQGKLGGEFDLPNRYRLAPADIIEFFNLAGKSGNNS